jgi:STE24 endopeptidase
LVTTPFFNAVSRRQEAAADWSALVATREPAAARSLQRRLAITSLSEPEPSAWSSFLFGTHPTAMERIGMTYAWERWSANGQENLGTSHLP